MPLLILFIRQRKLSAPLRDRTTTTKNSFSCMCVSKRILARILTCRQAKKPEQAHCTLTAPPPKRKSRWDVCVKVCVAFHVFIPRVLSTKLYRSPKRWNGKTPVPWLRLRQFARAEFSTWRKLAQTQFCVLPTGCWLLKPHTNLFPPLRQYRDAKPHPNGSLFVVSTRVPLPHLRFRR